ncbi:MAG: phosphatidylglycerol lysyltransferase domain-containing protein [Oscillospiraceae bacterium]|nr:phosphatidylglycerol lysyltransferase domain-containing protein [Oscillospiraceae bacterium]
MLNFTRLTLGDAAKIRDYFSHSAGMVCDNTVGGAFMWRDYFSTEYALYNQTLILKAVVRYNNGITAFTLPLGRDVKGGIAAIREYCEAQNIPLAFCAVTEEDLPALTALFKGAKCHKEDRWSDYIYNAEDLISLTGRKYNGQRNHINHFRKTFQNIAFEPISNQNMAEVKAFFRTWTPHRIHNRELYAEEKEKIFEVLEHYGAYGLLGGLLRADGRVVAFAAGEICGKVLHVHIEKADTQFRGAYQVIVNEFAKAYASEDVAFINRGEDDGDEGLRTSKRSYHPCRIIEKYIVLAQPSTVNLHEI